MMEIFKNYAIQLSIFLLILCSVFSYIYFRHRAALQKQKAINDYDLTFNLESDNSISIEAYGTYEKLTIKDLASQFASMSELDPYEGEVRIDDYYLMGEVSSNYGTYYIYLQMDEDWIQGYKAAPSSITYTFYIIGSDVEL